MTIRGPRFKCMHPDCPDYDLCVNCEAAPVPVHPESHPMLKTKTPLRINSKSSFDPIKNVYDDHCRYRVTRDCKRTKAAKPAQPAQPPASTPAVPEKPTASVSGFGGTYNLQDLSSKSSFARGEDYAKAVDAILKSMSDVSVKDGKASSTSETPKSASSRSTSTLPLKRPSPIVKEEPLVDLDSPVTSASQDAPPVAATFPGCALPRLPRGFDLSAEIKETETAKPDVREAEKNKEVKKPKKIIIHTKEGPTVVTKDEAPKAEEETKEERSEPIVAAAEAAAIPTPVAPVEAVVERSTSPEPEAQAADPLDILTWVRHTTIQPGTTLPPGAEFTKTWQLHHYAAGSEYDFKHLRLVHKSDGLLGNACKANIVFHPEDIVKNANMDVTIEGLKVPHIPGRQILEHWRFEDDQGRAYGQPLRIRVHVEERQSSGENTASSSFIVPRAPLEQAGDSFYLPTPTEGRPVPTSDELSERLSSVAPSTAGHDDDASSTFSFSDVEHITHASAARSTSTDDFTADDYDFVDETDEETEDGF
jgi:next-to-BRCA1 protein 1